MNDDNLAEWDAAYVLGALSDEDKRAYENYLAENPDRAAELTELNELPGLLGALSPDEALALLDESAAAGSPAPPQADLVPSLAQAAAKRQRRSRRTFVTGGLAVAAAMLIIGGLVGATAFPRSGPATQTLAMAEMTPGERPGVSAQLAASDREWGTELNWACQYTRDWARDVESYDLVVTTRDGTQTIVGTWQAVGEEATGLSAATRIRRSDIATVDIRETGTSEPLATTQL